MIDPSRVLDRHKRYQFAQRPSAWLSVAEKLQEAAELILTDQVKYEQPYFTAYEDASQRAQVSPDKSAEILCPPPNNVPAQMLYAFAIENLLKGLIIANDGERIGAKEITVATHDLVDLARQADFTLALQDKPILESLSELATWAGRYPADRTLKLRSARLPLDDPQYLLDFGSQHPYMRDIYKRVHTELISKVEQSSNQNSIIVIVSDELMKEHNDARAESLHGD